MKLKDHKYIQLEKSLQGYKTLLSKASDSILDQEVSNYPIFVLHKSEIDLGISLGSNLPGEWLVNASTLEELVARKVIQEKRLKDFKEIYKDPRKELCLFVVEEIGATFVFISRS